MQVLALVVAFLCHRYAAGAGTIVVPPSGTGPAASEQDSLDKPLPKPKIDNFIVNSDIQYRYARTRISTRIANPANVSQEVSFSAVLPDTAFISGFLMEIDGKVYTAHVKGKEEAKKEYEEAVSQGLTAGHVALNSRDSNQFTVSVNVEPQKKVTFNLTYEELLGRRLGVYRDVINLNPGQIVQDFKVEVNIQENLKLSVLRVPPLKVGNEIDANSTGKTNPLAKIQHPTPQSAIVTFAPSTKQQEALAKDGIQGQFIVEYDVDRKSDPGEILVDEGYFVHFFAPANLRPLSKQVTFVLDLSGSMNGRKIEQLREAMKQILSDLNKGDLFSIVVFSQSAEVWNPSFNQTQIDHLLRKVAGYEAYPESENEIPTPPPSVITKVTPENIEKAKNFASHLLAKGSTNIYDAMLLAVKITKLGALTYKKKTGGSGRGPEPIIIFLTDGLPNVHVSDTETIVSDVTDANTENCSIFSLALGNDADFNFLKKLSLRNAGFARKIYEASDTALQLTDFYKEVSSPLLANVKFEYEKSKIDDSNTTKREFRRLFSGSEIVVAGKITGQNFTGQVEANSATGKADYRFHPIIIPYPPRPYPPGPFPPPTRNHTPSVMERVWAYLTIKQLLDEDAAKDYDHNDESKASPERKRALELALKYSYVTPLTSLVVVKPNGSSAVDTQETNNGRTFDSFVPGQFSSYVLGPGVDLRGLRKSLLVRPLNGAYPIPIGLPLYRSTRAPIFKVPNTALASISDISWLPSVTKNNLVTLPTGVNGANEELQLASANQTNVAYDPCKTPSGESGHCRHLKFCVMRNFTAKEQDFLPYFCHIKKYVGVCCPDSI